MSQNSGYVLQNSPSSIVLTVEIHRGSAYTSLDMTTVTSLVGAAYTPTGGDTPAEWTFDIDAAQTTSETLVATRPFAAEDTAEVGYITLIMTPYVGDDALPPSLPIRLEVRSWR